MAAPRSSPSPWRMHRQGSASLQPFVLLQQDPCASQCWIVSGNHCLKSGTAHGFAAASLRGATTPPVSDPTEMCRFPCQLFYCCTHPPAPAPWRLRSANSNTHRSPAMPPAAAPLIPAGRSSLRCPLVLTQPGRAGILNSLRRQERGSGVVEQ